MFVIVSMHPSMLIAHGLLGMASDTVVKSMLSL